MRFDCPFNLDIIFVSSDGEMKPIEAAAGKIIFFWFRKNN
jgi:hypothetical protein